jgi:hypothetical protein
MNYPIPIKVYAIIEKALSLFKYLLVKIGLRIMKKLLYFLPYLILNCVFGQTLINNKTTFTQTNSDYTNIPFYTLSTGWSNDVRKTVDNIIPPNSGASACYANSGDYIIYDLETPRALTNISVLSYDGHTKEFYTAPSIYGPWVNVTNSITSPNKVSRYWKVLITSTINSNTLLSETQFFEKPLITASSLSLLNPGECITLTASAVNEAYLWSTGETTQSISICQPGTYTCQVTNTSFEGNQDHFASIVIGSPGTQDNWPTPNGEVYSIHQKDDVIYYGGDFNCVGLATGSSSLLDGISGLSIINFPRVFGTVNVTLSDGNGGWFIGGDFTRVGNHVINNLAHISSDNTVNLNFKPEPNGPVHALLLNGSNLYAGGDFTTVKGLTNNYLVKLNTSSGEPLFWNAFCNNIVRTLTFYQDLLIVGGDFTSLGGAAINRLAAVDTTFIQTTSWNPNPNGAVYKVFVNDNKLYVGGDFTTIGGSSKSRGAGFTLPAFSLDPYDFGANNRIHDFAFYNNVLYVAGTFTIIGGANRNYLAGLNPLNALANSFNATADGIIQSIAIYNGNLLAGGNFSNIGGAVRSRLASLVPTSGVANVWNPNVMGLKGTTYNVLSISSADGSVFVGGTFWSVGATERNNIAAINANTGELLPFNPNANNIVRTIASDANYIYLGGDFTIINSTISKNRIAQVNATSGLPTGWNPNSDGAVNTLVIHSGILYVGGAFSNIGGAARSRIASLSVATGAATAFNPSANGNVNVLYLSNDSLFIGGAYTTIGGQTRNRIAAYNISNGSLLGFNPNANNTVNAIGKKGSKIYFGGSFTSIGGTNVRILAEYDLLLNGVTSFNTGLINSSGVNAIAVQDSSVYLGGGYQHSNSGYPITNSSVIKVLSNAPGHWTPQPDDIVRAIHLSTNKIFLGGRFKTVQSRYQPYFTTMDFFYSGPTPSFINISSNEGCVGDEFIISGSNLNATTTVSVGGISVPFILNSSSSITLTPNTAVNGLISIVYPSGEINTNQILSINPSPSATITAGGATTFCDGGSVVLNANTGTGLSYQWRNNGTNISGATAASYTANAAGSYTVVVTNSSGCTATSTATSVTVNANPTATITAGGATTFCQGGSVVLNANTGTGLTYQWRNNGTNISGATAASYTANAAGSYTVVVTNSNGCTATSTATSVTVNANPSASITAGGTTTFCDGGSVVLNANTGTDLTYQWRNNGTNISGATSASYTANEAGSYTVVVTNSNGCTATSAATSVTVNANPSASITAGGTTTFCDGGSVVLNANTGTDLTYQWRNNGTNISGATAASYAANEAGSYTVVVTNSSGCSATSTATSVTVNANPTATISAGGATTFCDGGSVILNANTGTGLTYQWRNNGTNISGATAASYTANSSGSYTVVVTNSNGCSATSSASTVTVNPIITPAFTQVAAICSGGSLSPLPTTSANSISGTWSPALNNTATTTYTFSPTAGQCATSATMTITVNDNPTASITAGGATSFCEGGSVFLNANSGAGLIYQWQNNGTNISGATAASYTANAAGSYTVVVTNSNDCSATSTATQITVNNLPTVQAGSDQAICAGQSVTLSGSGATTYTWSNNVVNGVSFNPNSTASYTVIGTDDNGCSNSDEVTIQVNPLPQVHAGQDLTVCAGSPVTLSATGASSYSWNNNVQNGVSFVPVATTTYTVTGTDAETGCENTDEVLVTVNALPTVTLNLTTPICDTLQPFTLTGGLPLGGAYAGPSVASNSFNPAIGPGQYTIQYAYTDIFGCSNSAAQTITVIGCNTATISENDKTEIRIYPNPTATHVTIVAPEYVVGKRIYVYDLNGKLILETLLLETIQTVNLDTVATGSYYLKIEDETTTFKLIKH